MDVSQIIAWEDSDGRLWFCVPMRGLEVPADVTDEALVERAMRLSPMSTRAVRHIVIPRASLTGWDRYFERAWSVDWDTGAMSVNWPAARDVHMDVIRKGRNAELERESGSKYRQPEEIEAMFTPERQTRLQVLRDIPQTFSLSGFITLETLKAAWPTELPARD